MKRTLQRVARRAKAGLIDWQLRTETRLASAYARGAATAAARVIDPARPLTWEFSGFSQHGEDGILDYLCGKVLAPNRYFLEIGSADGIENCSAWLAFARSFSGVMVEGDPGLAAECSKAIGGRLWGVYNLCLMVERDTVPKILKMVPMRDPDVFILDIDSIDYYVCESVLAAGYRPKIVCVEYNSAFGPDEPVAIPYKPGFDRWSGHPSGLYYGVGLGAYRALLGRHGYEFVTVDSSGTNAFFVEPGAFPTGFAASLSGLHFADNVGDRNEATRPKPDATGDLVMPARDWRAQFELIRDLPLVRV